jgi:hypothetical protein
VEGGLTTRFAPLVVALAPIGLFCRWKEEGCCVRNRDDK